MIIKVLGPEVSIGSANTVSAVSRVIRVVNTGAAAVMNLQYANGVVYGNCTVTNTAPVIIEKARLDDRLVGTGMVAAPVSVRM